MANKKYKYFVIKDKKIVSSEFKEFKLAVPTFLHLLKSDNFNSHLAIIKFNETKDIASRIEEIEKDKNSNYYILTKFGSKNGIESGPFTLEDIKQEAEKTINTYSGNHCEFLGIIKATQKESKKLFNKVKSLN